MEGADSLGEWRLEIVFTMEDGDEAEEDHALTIGERCKAVVDSSALETFHIYMTKEF